MKTGEELYIMGGPVALYVMVAALTSFVSVYLATESFQEDLTEELAREPRGTARGAGQTT